MLNFMLKNLQNLYFGLRAYNQWLGKRTHILPTLQAVAGHAQVKYALNLFLLCGIF